MKVQIENHRRDTHGAKEGAKKEKRNRPIYLVVLFFLERCVGIAKELHHIWQDATLVEICNFLLLNFIF